MTPDEYRAIVERLIAGTSFAGIDPNAPSEDVLEYYRGHRPRFDAHHAILAKLPRLETVLDLGTWFPFASYFFHLRDSARVIYGCHVDVEAIEGCEFRNVNLCRRPDLPPADLVICTETLEHLPCNVVAVFDWLLGLVKPGGWFFTSFPCGGKGANNYETDHGDWGAVHAHIREFTQGTADDFIRHSKMEVVEEVSTVQDLYRAPIRNVLLRKPVQ